MSLNPRSPLILSVEDSISQIPIEANVEPPVWIVGSGMTVPVTKDGVTIPGVPGTRGLCDILIERVRDPDLRRTFKTQLDELYQTSNASENAAAAIGPKLVSLYNEVCGKLRLDADRLEVSIRRAVLGATFDVAGVEKAATSPNLMELGVGSFSRNPGFPVRPNGDWSVRPGLRGLVRFICSHPSRSGHAVLTTNFDPLISVAFHEIRGPHVRFSIDGDFPINAVAATVPVVYHVHGYWTTGRLLNLKGEINAETRARLTASLTNFLNGRKIYVLGYSGWDDVVMTSLSQALGSGARIDWLCHSDGEEFIGDSERVMGKFNTLGDQIRFVKGVDGDDYLQRAAATVSADESENEIFLGAELERRTVRKIWAKVHRLERKTDATLDGFSNAAAGIAAINSKFESLSDDLTESVAASNDHILSTSVGIQAIDLRLTKLNTAIAAVSNSVEEMFKSLLYIQRHVEFNSQWLRDSRYSRLNGLRPPLQTHEYPDPLEKKPG